MARIPLAIILLAVLATLASASAPSFCKCTCFQNSTIIPLGPQHDSQPAPPPPPPPPAAAAAKPPSSSSSTSTNPPSTTETSSQTNTHTRDFTLNPLSHLLTPREASTSCKQCNRAFCLKYNLPICKDAEEKDIKTTCFQRDSRKDQVIVWGFLLGTAGLLGWAAVRRVVESAKESRRRLGGQGQEMGGGGGGGGGRGRFGFGGFGGLSGDRGQGLGREGNNGRGRGLYDPLEDGDDGGAVRGTG